MHLSIIIVTVIIICVSLFFFSVSYSNGFPDQKVKKRKNRECTKCAKKTKTIQHSLRAIGEEIKEIEPENDSMLQMLHKKELGIKQQEADFCDSQNKIITAHENCVGALLQEPLVQNLMVSFSPSSF